MLGTSTMLPMLTMLFALSTMSFMVSSMPAASIQDSGFEEACLCTIVDGNSEGDITTVVTGLPVDPPKFFH